MKIACTTLACPDWTLQTVLQRFAEFGYDAVDFRGLGGEMNLWKLPAFSTELAATAERIAASGLAVSGMSSGARAFVADPGGRERALAEVRQYAKLCRALGCPMIRVFGGDVGDTPMAEAIPVSAEALRRMAEAAGEGVTVAVETHDTWVRTGPLAEVIARVGRDDVGVLWDLHHPFRLGGETPRQTYDNIGRHTVAVHVKDSRPTGDGGHEYTLAGEGDVPLAEMIGMLVRGGYRGYLTLEWEKKWHPELPGPEVALPQYGRFMKEVAP